MSPGFNELPACARFARAAARQSVCKSTRTCRLFASGLPHCALLLLDLWQQSELVLKVVADLVSNHTGSCAKWQVLLPTSQAPKGTLARSTSAYIKPTQRKRLTMTYKIQGGFQSFA